MSRSMRVLMGVGVTLLVGSAAIVIGATYEFVPPGFQVLTLASAPASLQACIVPLLVKYVL